MCHILVHCFPFIVMFVTQLSYSFNLNPHSIRLSDIASRKAMLSVIPVQCLLNLIYRIGFPVLKLHINFQYNLSSSFTIRYDISLSNNICTSVLMSA